MFQYFNGPWADPRKFEPRREVDFHLDGQEREISYWDAMANIEVTVREALVNAQRDSIQYVLFTHGWSTSRLGKTTARSVVRGFMRSPEATPLIIRKECIQHESVFLAYVRLEQSSRMRTCWEVSAELDSSANVA